MTIEMVLGDEYDADLPARLMAAVKAEEGAITNTEWGVGGSQELTVFRIALPDGEVGAIAETYMGLSLKGPRALVERLARRVLPDAALPPIADGSD